MPGVNFRRPKWCNFGNVRSFGPFFAQICARCTLFLQCAFASFARFLGGKRKPQVTSKSALIEKNCSRSKQKRNDLEIFGHQSCDRHDHFSGTKRHSTPAKPGVLFCLGNYATVYHFQRHFLEVKSCLFRPYRSLRVFTPLCGF